VAEGYRQLENRGFHQAIQSFERALALRPADVKAREGLARAHAGLGVEFTNSGEPGPAREAFERSLRSAEDPLARFGLGYLDYLEMRDGSARDHLLRALAKEPNDARTHKLLALLEYRKGETAAALKRMERAVELDPKDQECEAFRKRWVVEDELLNKLSETATSHFLVRSDRSLHPDAVREILADLERVHDAIGQALGHWPRQKVPVLLLAEAEFHSATGSVHWVGGVYDGQIKVPVKPEEGRPGADRAALLRTLRHEFAHVVVKELSPSCPNWLNEGIAQYFELGDDRTRDPLAERERAARAEKVKKELLSNRKQRLSLEKIPARMAEITDPGLARWSYLEGLGFVSYLVEKHRSFRLRLLLSAYRREGSLSKAFLATYGAPLAALEADWWKSIEA